MALDPAAGLHLWSYNDVGTLCCDHGSVMAACDDFSIAVCGRGGHGAAPRGTVDAIVEAATVVTALQAREEDAGATEGTESPRFTVPRTRRPLSAAASTPATLQSSTLGPSRGARRATSSLIASL